MRTRGGSRRLAGASALSFAVAACLYPVSARAPGPLSPRAVAAATTRWPDATEQSLAAGRELFLSKCNHCHGHPDVYAIAEARWPAILQRMGAKAELDASQTDGVLRFILAARTERPPEPD